MTSGETMYLGMAVAALAVFAFVVASLRADYVRWRDGAPRRAFEARGHSGALPQAAE